MLKFLLWFRLLLLFAVVNMSLSVSAQEFVVGNPLEIQPALSGNFGELRPNHFHAGIDLKTAAREGLPIHVVEDGFVSRIKISPYGYGKAIYVDHPNGYTTVYAHCQQFTDSIRGYVRRVQREQQSFEIEVFPGETDLKVKRGDVIALSGNTGGSGGPHLHFEVRETKSEVPRNPLLYGFPLEDTKRPVVQAIGIKPIGEGSTVQSSTKTYRSRVTGTRISAAQPIQVRGAFGLEISGFDQQNGSSNSNGIYKIESFLDGEMISRFVADSISFDKSRNLNALIDYTYYYQTKRRYVRLYRLPGNQLENIDYKKDGVLHPSPGEHEVKVVASDVSGNKTEVSFSIYFEPTDVEESSKKEILWNVPYFYETTDVKLYLPENTIYDNLEVDIETHPLADGAELLKVQQSNIPVQTPFEIRMRFDGEYDGRTIIAQTNSKGTPSRALATRKDGDWLVAESRSFGYFRISQDHHKPTISSINFSSGKTWNYGRMKFKVGDNFSGIQSYRALVDGEWVLMEYEPKQDLMFIDVNLLPKSKEKQHLLIEITDAVGNVANFEGTFYRL